MKSFLKQFTSVAALGILIPTTACLAQVSLAASTFANGGATLTGSHTLVGTFGQAIAGSAGSTLSSGFWNSTTDITNVGVMPDPTLPRAFSLDQNYPNPFNPTTVISYHLSAFSRVQLKVYDVFGRDVATLVDERKPSGSYTIHFNAANLASGVYLYRLLVVGAAGDSGGDSIQARKMILLH